MGNVVELAQLCICIFDSHFGFIAKIIFRSCSIIKYKLHIAAK